MKVHPSAFVDPAAVLAEDVEVGPFCVIGAAVRLGPGCRLLARVSIAGRVTAGRGNVFHPNASVGGPGDGPSASPGRIEIGDDNVFREGTVVLPPHAASGETRIGSSNRLHFLAEVGADARIGDGVLLGTRATLGSHVVVEDGAQLESLAVVARGVTLGRLSTTRSFFPLKQDVPPFMQTEWPEPGVVGVNPRCATPALERACRTVWHSGLRMDQALERLADDPSPEVAELIEFLRWRASREPVAEDTDE